MYMYIVHMCVYIYVSVMYMYIVHVHLLCIIHTYSTLYTIGLTGRTTRMDLHSLKPLHVHVCKIQECIHVCSLHVHGACGLVDS